MPAAGVGMLCVVRDRGSWRFGKVTATELQEPNPYRLVARVSIYGAREIRIGKNAKRWLVLKTDVNRRALVAALAKRVNGWRRLADLRTWCLQFATESARCRVEKHGWPIR